MAGFFGLFNFGMRELYSHYWPYNKANISFTLKYFMIFGNI